jgi:hypothetical protein
LPAASAEEGPPAESEEWLWMVDQLVVESSGIRRLQYVHKMANMRKASFADNALSRLDGLEQCLALEELCLEVCSCNACHSFGMTYVHRHDKHAHGCFLAWCCSQDTQSRAPARALGPNGLSAQMVLWHTSQQTAQISVGLSDDFGVAFVSVQIGTLATDGIINS